MGALLLAVVALLAVPGQPASPPVTAAAAATCVNTSLAQALARPATVAFVGTVSSVADSGLTAHVRVESVWQGSNPFPVAVDVKGGDPQQPIPYARRFTPGMKYLFVEPGGGSPFHDSLCSPTRQYSPALESYKPAGAHPPLPIAPTSGTAEAVASFLPWLGVLALVVLLTALLALRDHRRRPLA